jgi:phenylalanyl-tRNA synthetase alpha chain
MILFDIPDIRLFWVKDEKFLSQFKGKPLFEMKYLPYTNLENISKDISCWMPKGYSENDFYQLTRDKYGHNLESIVRIDTFTHPKTNQISLTYKMIFSCFDSTVADPAQFTHQINTDTVLFRDS